MLRFELIKDSGGAGEFRGGLGIRREYLNLADARFSIRSTKHVIPPSGAPAAGKAAPATSRSTRNRRRQTSADALRRLSAESGRRVPARYAGRRRLGDALERDPQHVLADVREGYVSPEAAERKYGVALTDDGDGARRGDEAATERQRAAMRSAKG